MTWSLENLLRLLVGTLKWCRTLVELRQFLKSKLSNDLAKICAYMFTSILCTVRIYIYINTYLYTQSIDTYFGLPF